MDTHELPLKIINLELRKGILDGKKVFQLMDTHGLPLEIINEELRNRQMGFNVVEFVEAAIASKNFTYKKIRARLIEAMLPQYRDDFTKELNTRFAYFEGDNQGGNKNGTL